MFLDWIEELSLGRVLLVGHNVLFDARILAHNIKEANLENRLHQVVEGFVDTLPMAKKVWPGKASYKLSSIYSEMVGGQFEAHNALADVNAMEALLSKLIPHVPDITPFYFSTSYSLQWQEFLLARQAKLATLKSLVTDKVLSNAMATASN